MDEILIWFHSARQWKLYKVLAANISVANLLAKAMNLPFHREEDFAAYGTKNLRRIITSPSFQLLEHTYVLPKLWDIGKSAWATSCLSRPVFKWHIPGAVAPPMKNWQAR